MIAQNRADCANPIIVWFRDDLRLADNPAFHSASRSGQPLICIFVHETSDEAPRQLGGAARWWLHGALLELDRALNAIEGQLWLFSGSSTQIIPPLAATCRASAVCWNRRYGAAERQIDDRVETSLKRHDIEVRSFNGHLLHEPWTIAAHTDVPFRVFSTFWRAALASGEPDAPLRAPSRVSFFKPNVELESHSARLCDLRLQPTAPDWTEGLRVAWRPGETAAQARLIEFLEDGFSIYATSRDRPDQPATSSLSPYLRFGNISVRQVWHAASAAARITRSELAKRNLEKFKSELGWREFSYYLLHHNSDIARRNLQPRFDNFAWRTDHKAFKAWQKGETGYPLVDAGMRQLWATGWMHNRVRMVVASFLVKDLLIDWRKGEAWFWDTLVDADGANNAASWQWVAGSGADAAPFFRIFNPILQGQKFDPDGAYVRQWVPELRHLPDKFIHCPWEMSKMALDGDQTAVAYPDRIVDHQYARHRALAAYKDSIDHKA